jgi:DNA polymerase-3 subunit delta'
MLNVRWPLVGHKKNLDLLTRSIRNNRAAHAYLFLGGRHLGKETVARRFANFILCRNFDFFHLENPAIDLEAACGQCPNCQQYERGLYPDIHELHLEYDEKNEKLKQAISVKQVRALEEKLTRRSFANSYKIVLIPEAEYLSEEASNGLLKFLEEPAARTVIILGAMSSDSVLPTIASRCRILNFVGVARADIYEELLRRGANRELALDLASVAANRPGMAFEFFAAPELFEDYKKTARALAGLLGAAGLKKIELLETAVGFENKRLIIDRLDILNSLIRDLELARLGENDLIVNRFLMPELEILTRQEERNFSLINKIEKVKSFLGQNVNPRIALESLFLN